MRTVNFGIDLGTTNSLISKYENGQVTIFKNPIGHKESLPSVVAFRKDRILVGDKAREYLLKDPVNVFGSFKRRMGTDDKFYVVNQDENTTPIELSALVLRELKQFVHTGETMAGVVITVPASFDTMQSNATKEAGERAGFKHIYLLQEPIAAGLAYFNNYNKDELSGYWLVYDLGGGTFDAALIEVQDDEIKVKDHEGNNFLGGVDFDRLMVEKLIVPAIVKETGIVGFEEELFRTYGIYEKLLYELIYKAEEAKKVLSVADSTELEFSANIGGVERDFYITITKDEFDNLIAANIEGTIKMLKDMLSRNNLYPENINEIVLVGGSTFIPYVREQLFVRTGIKVNASIDPTSAIAVGAGYYAANVYYDSEPDIQKETEETDYLSDIEKSIAHPLTLNVAYSKTCRKEDEVLLVKVEGDTDGYTYRITRLDGGFDTGLMALKPRVTAFLPLLQGAVNHFHFKIYDSAGQIVESLTREIDITHGQYDIAGQPLPKDICIEVDDKENQTTKLELIFAKNSILPLKKTLYREISKTVKMGSEDNIIINILEGDHYASTLSNLPIACIEISGKDLTSDLFRGSDIEIQIYISDSRELRTNVFLSMTGQEFENVFSISEKHVSIPRLKEQYEKLEGDFRKTVKDFSYQEETVWTIQANELHKQFLSYKEDLSKLKDDDKSDKKYIIAEAVARISQEFDKLGGNDRMERLISNYFDLKERVKETINNVNSEKEQFLDRLSKLEQSEEHVIRSHNPAGVSRLMNHLDDLDWDARWNTYSHIAFYYTYLKHFSANEYTNYASAQSLFKLGDKALEKESYLDLKKVVQSLFNLLKREETHIKTTEFKGTGIG